MLLTLSGLASAKTSLSGLKCEYLTNPLGLNVLHPRLTWQIESDEANVIQTAYEIRVAKSEDMTGQKNKLVWSSGKVNSAQSVNVECNGFQPESKTRYYWQVRIWDTNGKATSWSEAAWWETALMDSSSLESQLDYCPRKGCRGITVPFISEKSSPVRKMWVSARLYISSHGLFQVFINGKKVTTDLFAPGWTSYNKRTQYQTYDITRLLKHENAVGAIVGDGWYRGNIGGKVKRNYYGDQSALIAQIEISFSDGTSQLIATDATWETGNGPIILSDIYNGETYDATLETEGWDRPRFQSRIVYFCHYSGSA